MIKKTDFQENCDKIYVMYEMDNLTSIEKRLFCIDSSNSKKISISSSIQRSNIAVLFISSLLMMIVFLLMFIISFFVPSFSSNRFFYLIEACCIAAVFILCCTVLKKKPLATFIIIQFFITLLYFYGIYIGVISQSSNYAVTACLFLVVLPLLFTSRPLAIFNIATTSMVITAFLMVKFKDPKILIVDLVDVFFSWLMGVGLGITFSSLRIKNFVHEREIAIERDIDGHTGLLNKNSFERKMKKILAEKKSSGAFFMMDLDKFKVINDTCGHSYGDEVLVKVAECMREFFYQNAILGRFGGDEFVFFVPELDAARAGETARNLLLKLHDNVKLKGNLGDVHGSIGIEMVSSEVESNYESVLINADKALYVTKEQGRFGYTVYSTDHMESHRMESR